MSYDADVAVVGLGAFGAAAAWRLAVRGVDVLGLDRYPPGHVLGSSHGRTRMFRTACLEHPGLVPLARRSGELWEELAEASGEPIVAATGGVLIGPEAGHIVAGTLAAARTHGLPVELWDAPELRKRLPQHAGVGDHHCAVWEPSARVLRPELAIRAQVRLAADRGARVVTDCRLTRLESTAGGVRLHTPARTFAVRQVVMAAGPWLPEFLPDAPLRVVRMPQTWFRPATPDPRFDLAAFPIFLRELDDGRVLYGHGAEADGELKLGMEDPGGQFVEIGPEACDRTVGLADWAGVAAQLPRSVPGMTAAPSRAAVCFVTRTPDKQFLLGRPGGDPRLVVAGGCSGHGFKHATGVGEVIADLVTGAPPGVEVDFMHPDRFR